MPKIDKKIIKLTNKLNYPIILIFRVLTEFRRSCSRQQAFFLYYLSLFQQTKHNNKSNTFGFYHNDWRSGITKS